ncbi:MAG: 2,3-bisphosphoglycerate-independent phosphoglycerate mutase [Clostridia bacterium]
MKNPLALIILDGYGEAADTDRNAVSKANTPNLDKIRAEHSVCTLKCSGLDVGLPDGQMGNSEVGHTNIGAGRIVYQELTRITKGIKDGDFFENADLLSAVNHAKNNDTALHIFGLLSNGGVHSHTEHLFALLELAKRNGLTKVYLHGFMDGRDTPPASGIDFVKETEAKIAEIGVGAIATLSGRYYAMDRDARWDRVEKAYNALVLGQGEKGDSAVSVMEQSYANGLTDEFILPTIICEDGIINSNDAVIFANFRPDRAREITRTLVDPNFDGFQRQKTVELKYVCFTQYDASMPNVSVAFKPQSLANTFGEYISDLGLTQLRIAETEKYAHVTFFFNGGVEKVYPGEERALIKSPDVATYDLQPEMSAAELTDKVIENIESGKFDVIILNYANCDMVGHTGNFDAAVKAVEAVDTQVGRVIESLNAHCGTALITADHGNADQMFEADGVSPFTAHTTNPVSLMLVGSSAKLEDGSLCDIAPTMLELLGLAQPAEMTGKSLIK